MSMNECIPPSCPRWSPAVMKGVTLRSRVRRKFAHTHTHTHTNPCTPSSACKAVQAAAHRHGFGVTWRDELPPAGRPRVAPPRPLTPTATQPTSERCAPTACMPVHRCKKAGRTAGGNHTGDSRSRAVANCRRLAAELAANHKKCSTASDCNSG